MEEDNSIDRFCVSFLKHLSCGVLEDISKSENVYSERIYCDEKQTGGVLKEFHNNPTTTKFASLQGMKKYVQIILLVGLVVQLRAENRTMLLRDVYYFFKPMFRSQQESNKLILELGKIFELKRHHMKILPSSKGLLKGAVRYRFHGLHYDQHLTWIDGSDTGTCSGLPIDYRWCSVATNKIEVEILDPRVQFILVIEKEAIFHRIVEDGFLRRFPCILISSCGYPDVATRAVVAIMANLFPVLTVVGVCDYNPHGLALLICFNTTCSQTRVEASEFQTDIKWLGLRSIHIQSFEQRHENFRLNAMKFSKSDFQMIKYLENSEKVKSSLQLQIEVENMKMRKEKFELESLYSFGIDFVGDFIYLSLLNGDYT